jgi:hypothetical protein
VIQNAGGRSRLCATALEERGWLSSEEHRRHRATAAWWSEEPRRADVEEHGGRRTGAQAPEDGVGGGAGGCGEGNDDGALSAPYLDLSLLCFSVTTRSCPIFRA